MKPLFRNVIVLNLFIAMAWALPDLSITKTATPVNVNIDQNFTYTLTVTNNGTTNATSCALNDTLPAAVTYNSHSFVGWASCTYDIPTHSLSCNRLAALIPGASTTVTIDVTAPGTSQTVTNTATTAPTGADPDADNSDNVVSLDTYIGIPEADLSITHIDTPDPVEANGVLDYNITVENLGTGTATDIVVTVIPDNNVLYLSGIGTNWTCNEINATIICTYPSLVSGATADILVVSVNAPADSQKLTNVVSVDSNVSDPDTSNNDDTITTNVLPGDIEVTAQCDSFPKALNVFWDTGDINITGLNSIYSPDDELNTWNLNPTNNSACQGGTTDCNATNEDTKAINMPAFRTSGDNGCNSATEVTTNTSYYSGWHVQGQTLKYDIFPSAGGPAITKNAMTVKTNGNLTLDNTINPGIPFVMSCMTVESGATLVLEPGEYFFEEFHLNAGSTIIVSGVGDDTGTARVYVNPAEGADTATFTLTGTLNKTDNNASKLLVASYAAKMAISDTNINAYVHTASNTIEIDDNVTLLGAITAKDIVTVGGVGSEVVHQEPDLSGAINGCLGGKYTTPYQLTLYGPFVAHDDFPDYDVIQTKKVNNTFNFNVTHLNAADPQAIDTFTGTDSNSVYIKVIDNPLECNTSIQTDTNFFGTTITKVDDYVLATFTNGVQSMLFTADISPDLPYINTAERELYIKTRTFDFGELIQQWANAGISCVQQSTVNGNLDGVPQCLNDAKKLINVGYGHCVDFCESNDPLAKAGGCFECIVGKNAISRCSDSFSVRPEYFDINATNVVQSDDASVVVSLSQSYDPDSNDTAAHATKLRAGVDYDFSVIAYDFNETNPLKAASNGFDQNTSNIALTPVRWFTDSTKDTNGTLVGDLNNATSTLFANGTTAYILAYSDVGFITAELNDTDWTAIDIDDTPVLKRQILGNVNITVKPFEFAITDVSVANHNAAGFTYLSDDLNMSAKIPMTLTAQNKQGATTVNYADDLYEKAINLTLAVPDNAALGAALGDGNGTFVDLDFTAGVALLEDNDTRVLKFNYDRNVSTAVNPFRVEGSDVNVSARDTDFVTGDENGTLTNDITFFYGRVHAPRYRVRCDNPSAACDTAVNMYYEVYADNDANMTLVDVVSPDRLLSVDDVRWYQNVFHDATDIADNDGDVESFTPKNNALINDFSEMNITAGSPVSFGDFTYRGPVTSGGKGYPYKATIDINASSWLIFHRFNNNAQVNSFELEFNSGGDWIGQNPGTISVDSNASRNTTRRIEW